MFVSKNITVLMVEPGGWGGICHYTYNLCQALAHVGIRVTLLTAAPYELRDLPRGFCLRTGFRAETPYLGKLRCVAHSLHALRPDLLHIQGTFSARRDWLGLMRLRILDDPVIFTAHNILPHDAAERDAPGMRLSYRLIYGLSHGIIVHTETARRELIERFGISSRKIAVIPHGDYTFANTGKSLSPDEARRRLGLAPDCRVVLSFGAIREYKGIPDLIDAFAEVVEKVPDVFLVIAGKPIGIDPEQYRARIRRLGLQNRIVFRPEYVPFQKIGHYFQAADIAVFPYRAVCQSGALQLAYAFGKPVVVTRVGGLPETVREEENGFVVPPSDPSALAEALIRLLRQDGNALRRMGQRSRELAESRHGWHEIARQTENVYIRMISDLRKGKTWQTSTEEK